MEVKQILRRFKKYRKHLIVSFASGILFGLTIFLVPPKYLASGSFFVSRAIEKGPEEYFKYEGYYSQKNAQDYTNTCVALLESTDIKSQALEKLNIQINEQNLKKLKTQNLRDHMTDAELVFTALAELSTRQIAETTESKGLKENKIPAKKGGRIAKNARLELEQKTGRKVVSGQNYITGGKKIKKLKR